MTHGSLFSGIGGFDLAAEWMGWENLFHCEFNPFCQRILKYYWPNSKSYGDITKSTFIEFRGRIDILTGGFPCQPFSTAGKRKGTEDNRYLWPEMLRVIREVQPRYIVGENVRGLVSWDGGLVFDTVCSDLESEGYEVLPVLLPAAGVNAPHKRYRIWFVAKNTKCDGRIFGESEKDGADIRQFGDIGSRSSDGIYLQKGTSFNSNHKGGSSGLGQVQSWQNFPTVPPICNGDDGLSDRLDSITFSKWRNESIKGGGNAIVPQVALEIFKVIDKLNK